MIQPYTVSDDFFANLARGPASDATIGWLRSSQLTKHKLLLAYLAPVARGHDESARAFDILARAELRAPVEVGDLLLSPFVGAWATQCARRVNDTVTGDAPLRVELGAATALAAVAAARAGLDADLRLVARDGAVVLPTIGRLDVGPVDTVEAVVADGAVVCRTSRGETTIPVGSGHPVEASGGWAARRRIGAVAGGLEITLALEDLDPYRDCYRKVVAGRLSDADARRWGSLLTDAWALLVDAAPGRARELAGGLAALVPLSTADAEPGLSATSRAAFGALGLTLPPRPEHLAATLVHEFQHSKLSAVIDVAPLYDDSGNELYFAPWRRDPRPLGGLLQGVFAFVAVADFWRRLRARADIRTDADRMFADLREQLRESVATLRTAAHLNDDGRRVVAGIGRLLEDLIAEPVSETIVNASRASLRTTMDDWCARNANADTRVVADLTGVRDRGGR